MIRAHKIRLRPTSKQEDYLTKACDIARFTYNWGLNYWMEKYRISLSDSNIKRPRWTDVRKHLNSIKAEQFPWMSGITKCAPSYALRNLDAAFQRFWKRGPGSFPKFKRKGKCSDSFTLDSQSFWFDGSKIWIPNLGWVRMSERLRWEGNLLNATITCKANKWYVSITVDTEERSFEVPVSAVGIDLGVKDLAILSTGKVAPTQEYHKAQLIRLRRLNKELHRRVKGSANRKKTQAKLAALHAKVARQRLDHLHGITTNLADSYSVIGIEDLNVKGMVKNRRLARAVSEQGFGEFRRQLEYKTQERKTDLVIVDRWFPSSKLCSDCGFKNQELTLAVRRWICENCGSLHDRDINAAKNLKQEALRILGKSTGGSSGIACGDGSADFGGRKTNEVELPSAKQELCAVSANLAGKA